MNGEWVTQLLAFAVIIAVAYEIRTVPTHPTSPPTTRSQALLWLGVFLAIWVGLVIFLQFLLTFALVFSLVATGTEPDIVTLQQMVEAQLLPYGSVITLVSSLIAAFVGQVFFRRQSLLDLGLRLYRGWGWDFAMGIFLGAFGFVLLFALTAFTGQVAWGSATVSGQVLATSLAGSLAIFVMVAVGEELFARGYILQVGELGWGTITAVIVSSAVWALLHSFNPGSSLAAILNIMAAGMVYGYAYLITRSLWLPIALHLSWNFFEGPIFGFPVSGVSSPTLLSSQLVGPDFITGGSFGPEAGLVVLPILIIQVLILRWWTSGRRRLGAIHPAED